jgi:hypothetical protein
VMICAGVRYKGAFRNAGKASISATAVRSCQERFSGPVQ